MRVVAQRVSVESKRSKASRDKEVLRRIENRARIGKTSEKSCWVEWEETRGHMGEQARRRRLRGEVGNQI